jgi:hypothetical protein
MLVLEGTMRATLLLWSVGSTVASEGPPFSSFNCTSLSREAFESVTLKNSVCSSR